MFSYKFYPIPGNFTTSRMVWMVTFCKSAGGVHSHINHNVPYQGTEEPSFMFKNQKPRGKSSKVLLDGKRVPVYF